MSQNRALTGAAGDGSRALFELCLAQSQLAHSVIPAVVSGLRAGMPAECLAACAAAGGEGRAAIRLLSDCAHAHPGDPLRSAICEGLVQSELVESQIDFCD